MSAQQSTLDEFDPVRHHDSPDSDRCEAIAQRTGEQCLRNSLAGIPYCEHHVHLYDPDVD